MSQIYLGKRITTGRGRACAILKLGTCLERWAETRRSCAMQECSEREKNDEESDGKLGLNTVGPQWTLCEMPSFERSSVEK